MIRIKSSEIFLTIFMMLGTGNAMAENILVAVSSNFTNVISDIAGKFEESSGHQVTLSFGSTGRHYTQISNGAPFVVFLAADSRRPELLEAAGLAIEGSRFTYALGKLVLWSPKNEYVDPNGKVLLEGDFRFLAIANPVLAPYGLAAQEVLSTIGIWDELKGRMVRGENISQALQFVISGNAELGLLAYSQLKRPGQSIDGSIWNIPQTLYTPIQQQAVLLKESEAARAFLTFLKSDEALTIIENYGYERP
jgi:molybdate transport system substrate-binding protein